MAAASLLPFSAYAQDESDDLLNLSLAELSDISVTSVSKREEPEHEAPAAIYVITQEDIRRSGATAIPELLRMVPGITVTRAGAHDWTVTSRGSNDQFSNKLLVLMDGRTIYSPLFSGVQWDMQDTVLEDIERIEVIRGPGATLWGANAVNGVINIITKDAKDTQGGLIAGLRGEKINGITTARYGGKIGEGSYVRAYAKYTDYDEQYSLSGGSANDNWHKTQFGFRSDTQINDSRKLNIQGDIYKIDENALYTIPDLNAAPIYYTTARGVEAQGGNLQARWEEKLSDVSDVALQVYFDNSYQETVFFNNETNTFDLDFQHVWSGWEDHEIVWGAGYRFVSIKNDPTSQQYALSPQKRDDNLFNAFVQDKITLLPDELFLTLGSKFEHNDYTGVEIQPSGRISWLPDEKQTVWASVSRAVHTPYRYTDDGQQLLQIIPPGFLPTTVTFVGNRNLESEELIAYELGYRIQPTKSLSLDVAAFYNDYDSLFNVILGTPSVPGAYAFQPVIVDNNSSGESKGVEISSKWNVNNQWQLAGSYSYIDLTFSTKSNVAFSYVGKHPKHQYNLRSTYLLPYGVEMTNALYYMGELNGINVPSYYRFDTRFAYEITDGIEVSLTGQNLLDDRHQEFTGFLYANSAEIGRTVYGSISFKF